MFVKKGKDETKRKRDDQDEEKQKFDSFSCPSSSIVDGASKPAVSIKQAISDSTDTKWKKPIISTAICHTTTLQSTGKMPHWRQRNRPGVATNEALAKALIIAIDKMNMQSGRLHESVHAPNKLHACVDSHRMFSYKWRG